MPACGSSEEAACLRGLSATSKQGASPQGPAANPQLARRYRRQVPRAQQQQQQQPQPKRRASYVRRALGSLALVARKLVAYSLLAPLVWLSCWLCVGWLALRVPLAALGWLWRAAPARGDEAARRSCVLVSGGSSLQAVHLARSLSSLGARVVVCEIEGLLGLARFSSACARYYSLPRPGRRGAAAYVAALQDIVRREGCTHYVPVSASSPAYFDGLAKPHLELLGCRCFVPGAQELARLDDPLELLGRSERLGLPTPRHRLLDSLDEAATLYEDAGLAAVHYALPAGPAGMRERRALAELRLPPSLAEFRRRSAAQAAARGQRWLVVREPAGAHLVTCTTLRDSRVLANVTCRVDEVRGGALVPEDRPEVTRWLERFFSEQEPRPVTGHLSFRLVALQDKPGELVAIGCRVGVPLAYLCHGSVQASLILKRPCRHRQQMRPLGESIATASDGSPKLLDKREKLFLIRDPLPYCVYCYLQLPLGRFYEALGARAGCASRGGAIV